MSDARSLKMRCSLEGALPDVGPLREHMELHTTDADSRAAWNWIMKSAFPEYAGVMDYDRHILGDAGCAPERLFFLRFYGQDIAATAAEIDESGDGYIHWVGTHAAWTGLGASKWTIAAAMRSLKALGHKECFLTTHDFRLPAIRVYRALGFEPFYAADDEAMKAHWAAVEEKLAAYVRQERRAIPLWPKGCAPDAAACGGQAEPFVLPFPAEGSRGAVVVCAGGGDETEAYGGVPMARWLNGAGISAFVLRHRVMPFSSVDTPIGDARRAIRLARSMGYEKVGVLGFSAGGHIAAMTAVDFDAGDPNAADPIERFSSRPDAFVSCCGMTSFLKRRGDDRMRALLGGAAADEAVLARYSAECRVTDGTPPGFIWQTAEDELVPCAAAFELARALIDHGVGCALHIFPHGPHGLNMAGRDPAVQVWAAQMNRWLLGLGFGKD